MNYYLSPILYAKLYGKYFTTRNIIEHLQETYNLEFVHDNDPFSPLYLGSVSGEEKDINWFILKES